MDVNKKIGRIALLKYYLVIIVIIMLIPVTIEMYYWKGMDFIGAINSTYKINTLEKNEIVCLLIQLITITACIWFVGGKLGEAIINKIEHKFTLSLIAICVMWILSGLISIIIKLVSDYLLGKRIYTDDLIEHYPH